MSPGASKAEFSVYAPSVAKRDSEGPKLRSLLPTECSTAESRLSDGLNAAETFVRLRYGRNAQ
jgi:hypothetical protein